jgi:hypothetical protein
VGRLKSSNRKGLQMSKSYRIGCNDFVQQRGWNNPFDPDLYPDDFLAYNQGYTFGKNFEKKNFNPYQIGVHDYKYRYRNPYEKDSRQWNDYNDGYKESEKAFTDLVSYALIQMKEKSDVDTL